MANVRGLASRRAGVWAAGAALLVGSGLLSGCGASAESNEDEYVFAVTGELTGASAPTYQPTVAGARAAINLINDEGGINGKQIKLAGPFDSQSDAAGASTAAQQAVNAQPDAIFSLGGSLSTTAGLPVYERAGVPSFSLSGGDDAIFPPISGHYSVMISSTQVAQAFIDQARTLVDAETLRVGIVGFTTPAVDSQIAGLEALDEADDTVEIVAVERTLDATASFAAQAAKMVKAKPDVIVLISMLEGTIENVDALTKAGYQGPYVAPLGAANVTALKAIGNPDFHALHVARVLGADDPLLPAAKAVDAEAAAMDSAYFSQGFATVYAAARILGECGESCDSEAFDEAAAELGEFELDKEVLYGPLIFSAERHYGLTAVQFKHWDPATGAPADSGEPLALID